MKTNRKLLFPKKILFLLFAILLVFYSNNSYSQEQTKTDKKQIEEKGTDHKKAEEKNTKVRGEHSRNKSKVSSGAEKEKKVDLDATYDVVKNGVRVLLSFEKATNSFLGTLENTTNKQINNVKVEIHLSNGTKLGPTRSTNLLPGSAQKFLLKATEKSFDSWSAYAYINDNN